MAKGKYQEWLTDEGLLKLEGWARDGLTDEQIAHNMGITSKTLYEWKNKYGEICESLKRGKEVVDRKVENALLSKAIGFTKTIEKPIKVKEVIYKDGKRVKETEHIEYANEEVYIPPDTTAGIFWLKNRKPEQWRDKRDIALEGSVKTNIENLSDEELNEKIAKLEKQVGVASE